MTQLWSHQQAGITHALNNRATMLAYDMGTGKTRTAIEAARQAGAQKILILCPKAVVPVWPREFAKWWPECPHAVFAPTTGTGAAKDKILHAQKPPVVVALNYEAAYRKPLGESLARVKWDMVIFDEIHRIKAHNGKASKWARRLNSARKLGLSGTPLPHSPLDAFGVYGALDERIFGRFWTPFRAQYAVMGGPNMQWVKGVKNTDQLQARIAPHTLFVKSDDVLDLPETQDIWLWYDMNATQARIYRELEEELISEIEGGEITVANALVKLLRLQQIACGYIADDAKNVRELTPSGDGKPALLTDLLEDIPKEPVVVFCKFTHDLDAIQRACKTAGRPCFELSGRMNELTRWDLNSHEPPVLACQIQAGGVGIDLTRSRYVVYYSTGFSLGDYLQSRKRVHRPGQTRHCFYYHLGANNSVEVKIAGALAERQELVESIVSSFSVAPRVHAGAQLGAHS